MSYESRNDEGLGDFPALLEASRLGDRAAWSKIVTHVYADLRRMAKQHRIGAARDGTLNTTGLVHESYLRLTRAMRGNIEGRAHFFALASRVMRQIMCDYARERLTLKRGVSYQHSQVDEVDIPEEQEARSLIEMDRHLNELSQKHPRWSQIVELRFFTGLGEAETAEVVGTSLRTVQREWRAAKQWLSERIGEA